MVLSVQQKRKIIKILPQLGWKDNFKQIFLKYREVLLGASGFNQELYPLWLKKNYKNEASLYLLNQPVSIWPSVVYSDWQQLPRNAGRDLSQTSCPKCFKWRCRGSNQGSSACTTCAPPLGYDPLLRIPKYYIIKSCYCCIFSLSINHHDSFSGRSGLWIPQRIA